ncbi:dihydrolipoamide acetyltransferase family protein [Maribellus sp. YY47]|uniref:dihydrolipoamide acetyltransferase family protein n=1 Tax=Maribellus sp. YY47 TaxID=2929486 RepID=UPI0020007B58|nr:dihydrolipoamide acetyltransferase family protein [Maribellus sp. YY47]MCK3682729.1 2-oxo acid dehydrogenase subunit E2 [Maribellus sp. YY47]
MATPVMMPRQGQSVESCILGQWYKEVGEDVNEGDILFSYETDKASFEEEAKEAGTLLARFFEEGDEIPVLTNVAVIGKKGESIDEFKPGASAGDEENTPETPAEEAPKVFEFEVEEEQSGARLRISPLARNMAEKMGVEIQTLKGTGPHGRIIARDVEEAAQKPAAAKTVVEKPAPKAVPVSKPAPAAVIESGDDFEVKSIPNIRKLIANAMHQSLQNSAQLTHHMSADARQLMKLRKKFKAQLEAGEIKQNVTINDLVCYAVIRALEKYPQANTHFLGDKMKWFKKVHLGLAVDTERGLMVPALKNADDLSITGLSSQLKQLSTAARAGNVNPDLLSPAAATFTVSNLGNYGVEMFTPVINLPQTAILGVCTIVPRPKELEEGVYGFVPMMGLSLTYDHQALDGGEATLFLAEIKNQIENLQV